MRHTFDRIEVNATVPNLGRLVVGLLTTGSFASLLLMVGLLIHVARPNPANTCLVNEALEHCTSLLPPELQNLPSTYDVSDHWIAGELTPEWIAEELNLPVDAVRRVLGPPSPKLVHLDDSLTEREFLELESSQIRSGLDWATWMQHRPLPDSIEAEVVSRLNEEYDSFVFMQGGFEELEHFRRKRVLVPLWEARRPDVWERVVPFVALGTPFLMLSLAFAVALFRRRPITVSITPSLLKVDGRSVLFEDCEPDPTSVLGLRQKDGGLVELPAPYQLADHHRQQVTAAVAQAIRLAGDSTEHPEALQRVASLVQNSEREAL